MGSRNPRPRRDGGLFLLQPQRPLSPSPALSHRLPAQSGEESGAGLGRQQALEMRFLRSRSPSRLREAGADASCLSVSISPASLSSDKSLSEALNTPLFLKLSCFGSQSYFLLACSAFSSAPPMSSLPFHPFHVSVPLGLTLRPLVLRFLFIYHHLCLLILFTPLWE